MDRISLRGGYIFREIAVHNGSLLLASQLVAALLGADVQNVDVSVCYHRYAGGEPLHALRQRLAALNRRYAIHAPTEHENSLFA